MTIPPKPPNKIPKPPKKISEPPILPKSLPPNRNIEYYMGETLPFAVDLEEVILGALMIDKKGIVEVMNFMKHEYFYSDYHKKIFTAIERLYDNNNPVDLLTVSQELKKMNQLAYVGGDYYLISLTQKVSSSAHIEFHCRIVIQKWILREIIFTSYQVLESAYKNDPDVFNLIDTIQNKMSKILLDVAPDHSNIISTNAEDELRQKVADVRAGKPPGVNSSIQEFDDWCGGFHKRELITVAARPGMGKTTATLAIVAGASLDFGIPTAFFALEMTETDCKNRLASRGTEIEYSDIRNGRLTDAQLNEVTNYFDYIDKSCLHIVDNMRFLHLIVAKIRKLVALGVKLVVIDYVQLIKLAKTTGGKTEDLNVITGELKSLANELNIPIVIAAQLSRSVDTRPGHRPILGDLKQSGSIEEDSDTVIFLLRMAYYEQLKGNLVPPHMQGRTDWIVAKGRNIGTNNFVVMLDFRHYKFLPYSD